MTYLKCHHQLEHMSQRVNGLYSLLFQVQGQVKILIEQFLQKSNFLFMGKEEEKTSEKNCDIIFQLSHHYCIGK